MFKKKRYYPPKRPANYRPDYHRYEAEKQAWLDANSQRAYTEQEFHEAIREICRRCGI